MWVPAANKVYLTSSVKWVKHSLPQRGKTLSSANQSLGVMTTHPTLVRDTTSMVLSRTPTLLPSMRRATYLDISTSLEQRNVLTNRRERRAPSTQAIELYIIMTAVLARCSAAALANAPSATYSSGATRQSRL
jgi:hypothetical protein